VLEKPRGTALYWQSENAAVKYAELLGADGNFAECMGTLFRHFVSSTGTPPPC